MIDIHEWTILSNIFTISDVECAFDDVSECNLKV